MARGKDEHDARANEVSYFGKDLARRAKSCCELCSDNTSLTIYEIPPVKDPDIEKCVMICAPCREQLENDKSFNINHWHCLNDTAWSEIPAVQVLAWRLLKKIGKTEPWGQDLLEQMYLDEEVQEWAEDDGSKKSVGPSGVKTVDSNGATLEEGDTVTIIKDLDVKGAGFVAKRGTTVKNIHLGNDPELIEGRVNKTKIFLKTCFLKKLG